MGYLELDTMLSDEVKATYETANKFAMDVLRPVGMKLDKLVNPEDVIAHGSPLWDTFKTYRELGFHRIGIHDELGGLANTLDPKAGIIIAEQMGYGDAGLAVSLTADGNPFHIAALSPDPEMRDLARSYCEDVRAELIGCWAITEPDHGSDWIMAVTKDFNDPRCGPSVKAQLVGDEYIITGQKSAWVSNGVIATHAALHVGLDSSQGMHGSGLAVVSLDRPGISRGKPLDKIGQRPLNQGEIFFEEVKIPKNHMIIAEPSIMRLFGKPILSAANGGMGVIFVGLAQAILEETTAYAKSRIQGGVPIFNHQNIKLKLFDIFTKVEYARAFARRMALYNLANRQTPSPIHAIAAKLISTQAAFDAASIAIQVFGAAGLSREYPIEKMFRDAKSSMLEDGENSALALAAAEDL